VPRNAPAPFVPAGPICPAKGVRSRASLFLFLFYCVLETLTKTCGLLLRLEVEQVSPAPGRQAGEDGPRRA
jgi:hypothetical protein